MRRAGPVSQDLGTLKINFTFAWENLSPASWDRVAGIPGSLDGLKIYHVMAIAGPAQLAGPTLSRNCFSLQSKMAHKKSDISVYITHKGLSDHKAT